MISQLLQFALGATAAATLVPSTIVAAELRSSSVGAVVSAPPPPSFERPRHMKRKAARHRRGANALLSRGTIRKTLRDLKRNQASNDSSDDDRYNRRDRFRCNDEKEHTFLCDDDDDDDDEALARICYQCLRMDQRHFVSNAELGSQAAIEYTASCTDYSEEEGFDYINDIWTYESPSTGNKYALVGMWDGTSFVDVTDPSYPIVVGFLDGRGNLEDCDNGWWRDVKVMNGFAYIGAEPRYSGIQIVDLDRLDSLPRPEEESRRTRGDIPRIEADAYIDTIGASHNLIEFVEEGKLLVVGIGAADTTACRVPRGETVVVLDVEADPLDPPIGCLRLGSRSFNRRNRLPYATMNSSPGYVHDGQCFVYDGPDVKYRNEPLCIFFAETEIGIFRMLPDGDATEAQVISQFSYPGATFVHQGWVSEDFSTLYANDEGDEERIAASRGRRRNNSEEAYPNTRIFDISSLEDAGEVPPREFINKKVHPSIDHNMYVRGGYVYSANYEAGARVYKIAEEDMSLKEVAFFDVSNDCDDVENCADPYGGTWTHVPFDSDASTTIASNGFYGLHLFHVRLDDDEVETNLLADLESA